jgi:hypothetical protein
MIVGIKDGFGPVVSHSREGYPVYVYKDPRSKAIGYAVILPDGRAYLSDAQGRINAGSNEGAAEVGGALALGTSALLLGAGPVGGVVAALVGAIAANRLRKRAA